MYTTYAAFDVYLVIQSASHTSHSLAHFHEWTEDDKIEKSDFYVKVVTDEVFDYLMDHSTTIPEALIDHMNDRYVEMYEINSGGGKFRRLKLLGISTETQIAVLTFETEDGLFKITGKSHVPPKNSRRILNDRPDGMAAFTMDMLIESQGGKLDVDLSVDALQSIFAGLTRKEREMKMLISAAVRKLKNKATKSMVAYLYQVAFNTSEVPKRTIADNLEVIDLWVKGGWSESHIEFGDELMKIVKSDAKHWEELRNTKKIQKS